MDPKYCIWCGPKLRQPQIWLLGVNKNLRINNKFSGINRFVHCLIFSDI